MGCERSISGYCSPPPGPEDEQYPHWQQWRTYEGRTKYYTSGFLERMLSAQETFDPRPGEGLEGAFITYLAQVHD
jgi:hypothetical protein